MLNISILKVENPSCIWARVAGGSETTDQYESLLAQMNLFYHDVTQDLRRLRPTSVEEGQVFVVYWSTAKSWCRAVVESIIVDSVSCRARCLLVDYGERLVISTDQIRVAEQKFLQLPFWVQHFHLARIKPTTLRVSVLEERAELIPSSLWDSSATLYLHNLLRVSTLTEAVLRESQTESTAIELYLTVGSVKVCMNDDLVAKKFALYVREAPDGGAGLDEADKHPLMLSSSVFACQSPSGRPAGPRPPPVMSQGFTAADWLVAPPTHETRAQPEEEEEEEEKHAASPCVQSPAAESGASEDTDSSLAAALTRNLSLFRFLKFLNPGSSFQPPAPSVDQHEELQDLGPAESTSSGQDQLRAEPAAELLPESRDLQQPAAEDRSCRTEPAEAGLCPGGPADPEPAEKTWRSEDDWACARLLEWLNPDPVNPDPDSADDEVPPGAPSEAGVLVHSAAPLEPCASMDDAPVMEALRRVLCRTQLDSLSPVDRFSWPAVARGCNTIIISHGADQPLCYLPPLLTHIQLNSIYASLSCSTGPVAVLLCPGWEKVQLVYELLEQVKVAPTLHPTIALLGVGKDEAEAARIPKSCLLLVTTPFSLVRLLNHCCFLFLRLYHLVLDEADRLFALAPDEMSTILQHFHKVASSEDKASCPQQLVVAAKRWSSHMDGLIANHMPCPSVVIGVPEEAALYADVQQNILMTLESSKISVLLGALDFNPDVGQKTLIVTGSAQEVEDVFQAVSNRSAFCLKVHEGLTWDVDSVVQQWRKEVGRSTHVFLVTTSECLQCLGIRDATCVVHHSFPSSPRAFGGRLSCMADNFRNLSTRDQRENRGPLRSVLLISDRNARHVVGVLRYLERTNAPLPPELLTFAQGVASAREAQKTSRPVCSYLKSFGVCRDSGSCPDRHTFLPRLDQSLLPAAGVLEVLPLHVKTASVFYGRIVRKEDGDFRSLMSDMSEFYAVKKPGATELLEGGFYAVEEEDAFHRVKILSVPDRGGRLFFSLLVRFIDVGKEEEVKSHQILQLPERFQALEAQAVEMVLCRVQPVDLEADWHPKVTRAVSQRIRGQLHRARVVFSLGDAIFIDPMVRVTQVPGMKTVINEYSVQTEITKTGMGTTNPDHVDRLRALWRDCMASSMSVGSGPASVGSGPASLVNGPASGKSGPASLNGPAPGEDCRLPDLPPLQPCEPSGSSGIQHLLLSPAAGLRSAKVTQRLVEEETSLASVFTFRLSSTISQTSAANGTSPAVGQDLDLTPLSSVLDSVETPVVDSSAGFHLDDRNHQQDSGDQDSGDQDPGDQTHSLSTKRFHPQLLWYQTPDSVVLTVKLLNPERQRCDFFPDRVLYSGSAGGRFYCADLELQGAIAAERCSWEMKSNEPRLRLVKDRRGPWDRLLRKKNIFVSYDMEHVDEDEDRSPEGPCFVASTGEDNCYVNSESGMSHKDQSIVFCPLETEQKQEASGTSRAQITASQEKQSSRSDGGDEAERLL
ncbi:uncharacterized protein V6R79_019935 [Siganus canaliculatus]